VTFYLLFSTLFLFEPPAKRPGSLILRPLPLQPQHKHLVKINKCEPWFLQYDARTTFNIFKFADPTFINHHFRERSYDLAKKQLNRI
jgi:hypothetical protein